MAKKLALGKGMASLIQEAPSEVVNMALREESVQSVKEESNNTSLVDLVDVSQISPNPGQPRKIFKEKDLNDLSNSIKENGVLQPLIVYKAEEDGFILIAGERRLRASIMAGIEKVPVIVKKATEREKLIMSIIENVQRSDLNCVEEALAYFQLMEDYNLTQEEVAKKLGKERSSIANFLRILKLPRDVIEMLQKELLSFGHAKVLCSIKDPDIASRLASVGVSKNLSVRELEKLVKLKSQPGKTVEQNPYLDDKLDSLRQKLEQFTGFHFSIKSGKKGSGQITIKYGNEAEFNDIYEYLLRRQDGKEKR